MQRSVLGLLSDAEGGLGTASAGEFDLPRCRISRVISERREWLRIIARNSTTERTGGPPVTQPPADRRPPSRPRRALAGRDRTRPPARPVRHDARRDDLDAYVEKIVDSLPPLTDEQRDLLAMIFRSRHRRKLT